MIEILSKRRGPWYRLRRPVVLARVDAETLEGANLAGARLSGALLRGAVLNRAKLTDASLEEADLWGAKLTSVSLQGAQLRGADLSGAILVTANLNDARLDECNLWGANLAGARLQNASLAGADLSGARLAPANLTRANLNGARLTNAYLVGTRLEGATLRGAILAHADLSGASLSGVNLDYANLHEARLAEADLLGASLRNALLAGAVAPDANLEEANLLGVVARQANLSRANLRGATLVNADLTAAVLTGADLRAADLHEARLQKADLREADLTGAQVPDAKLDDVDARGMRAAKGVLTGASLCRADLAGADLRGADLRGANLWGAQLRRADLRGANLLGAILAEHQRAEAITDENTQWPLAVGANGGGSPAQSEKSAPKVFREHKATIVDVAVSPDGSLALSGDVSGEVILWDPRQLRPIHHFVVPSEVRGISMAQRDGLAVVVATGRTTAGDLRIWNVQTLSEVSRLSLDQSPQHVVLSPSGDWAVISGPNELRAWQLIEQKSGWRFPLPGERLHQLKLTDDGRTITCISPSRLLTLDSESGTERTSVVFSNGPVIAAALSADGRWVATVGEDSTARLWSIPWQGEPKSTLTLKQPPRSLTLSPDGNLLAYAAADHRVRILHTSNGEDAGVYELPSLSGRHIEFMPDGRSLLVAGEDRCVRLLSTEY